MLFIRINKRQFDTYTNNLFSDDDEQLDKELNQWSGGTQYHGVDQRTEPLAIIISVIILLLLIGLNIVIIECF